MAHPYRRSFLKRQHNGNMPGDPEQLPAHDSFALAVDANTALLRFSGSGLDRIPIDALKIALRDALRNGVNVVRIDPGAISGPDCAKLILLLNFDQSLKVEILPEPR